MNRKTYVILVLLGLLTAGCARPPARTPGASPPGVTPPVQTFTQPAQAATPAVPVSPSAWIDTHTHASTNIVSIDQAGGSREDFAYCVSEACLESMVTIMDEVDTSHTILMPPPAPAGAGDLQYEEDLVNAARQHPDRFFYMGGGSVLNALIHQTTKAGQVSESARSEFEAAAKAMLANGAIGFGEMSILHLSASANHAFEEVPADHELFLLLADVAAQHDVPIDIHMDPVIEDMQTPAPLLERSAQNPVTLQGNIESFEALLAHNADARIVWAHTDDTTGDLSAELLREMLGRHPNLYLSLRLSLPRGPAFSRKDNVLDDSGNVRQEWLDLIEDYADRFVIGSDTFWGGGEAGPSQILVASFLAQLPGDVAQMVACRNVTAIYKLDVACP